VDYRTGVLSQCHARLLKAIKTPDLKGSKPRGAPDEDSALIVPIMAQAI
jgi:hypothetical protein